MKKKYTLPGKILKIFIFRFFVEMSKKPTDEWFACVICYYKRDKLKNMLKTEEIEQLKEGVDIVFGDFYKGDKDDYICYFDKKDQGGVPVVNLGSNYYHLGSVGYPRFKITRRATSKEAAWLKACQKANKFIPLEEIIKEEVQLFIW